jgi:hypothetical protein
MICTDQVVCGDDIEVDKMGGVCVVNGGKNNCIDNFNGQMTG